jgi:hypothetical protein
VSTSAQSKPERTPIPVPEPGLAPEILIERAIALRELIREE